MANKASPCHLVVGMWQTKRPHATDDSISQAVSACLAKLKKGGKADNPSTGLWKLI
ncbi:MAG TPA: hypothetical protein VFD00_06300 [Thermoclostridium sp.]|nr:hypothetical protein [Thermoclostridium sp.]